MRRATLSNYEPGRAAGIGVSVTRYAAFDGLRALLALLFLALHSSLPYVVTPLEGIWPLKDPSTHIGFDVFALLIHSFRLPLFFILAGFFAAMIYETRGPRAFISNRLRRIALPLAAAWLIVAPAIVLAVRVPLQWFHLWFLFDLLVYYAIALLAARMLRALPPATRRRAADQAGTFLRSPWAPAALAGVTAVSLLPMRSGLLETPGSFARPISTLAANGTFILFGWVLWLRREAIAAIEARARLYMGAGVLLFLLYLACFLQLAAGDLQHRLPTVLSLSGCTWLIALGLLGLFERYYRRPHRIGSYLGDASYWCYLFHLPVVVFSALVLAHMTMPAIAKFTIVFSFTTGVCLLTYHVLVRRTILGALLSGRRACGGLDKARGVHFPPASERGPARSMVQPDDA